MVASVVFISSSLSSSSSSISLPSSLPLRDQAMGGEMFTSVHSIRLVWSSTFWRDEMEDVSGWAGEREITYAGAAARGAGARWVGASATAALHDDGWDWGLGVWVGLEVGGM